MNKHYTITYKYKGATLTKNVDAASKYEAKRKFKKMYPEFEYVGCAELTLKCPLGGDESDDCADCVYGTEYHFECGNCIEREKSTNVNDSHRPFG